MKPLRHAPFRDGIISCQNIDPTNLVNLPNCNRLPYGSLLADHKGPERRYTHRRGIKTEEKAKVVAVGWGAYLNAALTI